MNKPNLKPTVCLVLHAHMPYVLRHGHWPHGEVWLMEAVVGVYLPLIKTLRHLSNQSLSLSFALGLTPVLLLQLSDKDFQNRLEKYLKELIEKAQSDASNNDFRAIAEHWANHYAELYALYLNIDKDLPAEFTVFQEQGLLELLGGMATHPYSALINSDRSIDRQLEIGNRISQSILGNISRGIWLPECSHRPQVHRSDPISGGPEQLRYGIDRIMERNGVSHYFVESDLFGSARSEGVVRHGAFHKCDWEAVNQYPEMMWRSVLEPHLVNTMGQNSRITAFARHPEACAQVWAADGGYPGDSSYLEFHKRVNGDGHRYWRVTDRSIGLGGKKLYNYSAAALTARSHALDYVKKIEGWLSTHPFGRPATLNLCFDAELFGHWWFEGPVFLKQLLTLLGQHSGIQCVSPAVRLKTAKPEKIVWLGEGSWGAGADHRVWWSDKTQWMWESIHRAEKRFYGLFDRIESSSRPNKKVQSLMPHFEWALQLLQSSDWIFVITTKGAVDYGYQRFCKHLERFEALAEGVESGLGKRKPTEHVSLLIKEAIIQQPAPKGIFQ
jgi:1,4-alpha-glucan branching enzyme